MFPTTYLLGKRCSPSFLVPQKEDFPLPTFTFSSAQKKLLKHHITYILFSVFGIHRLYTMNSSQPVSTTPISFQDRLRLKIYRAEAFSPLFMERQSHGHWDVQSPENAFSRNAIPPWILDRSCETFPITQSSPVL